MTSGPWKAPTKIEDEHTVHLRYPRPGEQGRPTPALVWFHIVVAVGCALGIAYAVGWFLVELIVREARIIP